ncbi:MAG: hypothetical protein JW850_07835 [Thermoflexales bacterium]|nr:hypothetical protein [Thermoflexales bacterium]
MPFPNQPQYEVMIYGVLGAYPQVATSTLRLYSTSALTAIVEGELEFKTGLRLRVIEMIDFEVGKVRHYSYTIYSGGQKIRWYDSQPHPDDPSLASTFPHHYHEPPDIKRNRCPAPGISFDAPNLSTLIADCLQLGKSL